MGVTLERVQFKFASIIGELCNEPQILSQFAVWLDMRLAEFKLKGSISLDCSGDPVPPGWLDGLEEAMADQMSRKQKHRAQKVTTIPDHDDDVIITDSNQIVSVSGRVGMGGYSSHDSNHLSNNHRKRTHQSWHGDDSYKSNPKNQRSSSKDSGIINNQSLMSIIADHAEEGYDLSQSRSTSSLHSMSQYNEEAHSEQTYELVEQTESEAKQLLQGNDISQYFQSSNETSPTVNYSQSHSSTQSERSNSLYLNSLPYMYATGHPQRRERSIWSTEEKAAIHTYLLPIVQRTKKPPTKSEIQDLMNREPVLRQRHWEKIKFQAWSLYQSLVKRQNNLTAQSRNKNRDTSPRKTQSELNNSQCEKTGNVNNGV